MKINEIIKRDKVLKELQAKLAQAIEDTKEEIEFLRKLFFCDDLSCSVCRDRIEERIKQKEAEIK